MPTEVPMEEENILLEAPGMLLLISPIKSQSCQGAGQENLLPAHSCTAHPRCVVMTRTKLT